MKLATTEREKQRVDHLVLGRPRPAPVIGKKPEGMSKIEWKAAKAAMRARGAELADGIEQRVVLVEQFGGRNGTPETIAHLDARERRAGAIARLYMSGAIDADQLAAADKIAATYRAVMADTPLKTASWETRTGGGGVGGDGVELTTIEIAYGRYALEWWLRSITQPAAMLAIVAEDVALTNAARLFALSVPRTRTLLCEALTTWWARYGRGEVVAS
ncbi:hypothetical protein [Sphingomonas endophytica]|uniref:Uncharacterized protein n=1 Tax=Sphingomonas endophytica TaxID=869719 RepID=A0A147I3K0_9SPHN|nr:hypothetical protein [Sphingomonas endophytica]KTT72632.1 hypothetical protein NS334_08545 [Sphingomonas endophytica]